MPAAKNPKERFFQKISIQPNSCWLWMAATDDKGYARLLVHGKNIRAHRWAYQQFVGPIPEDCEIDHRCRNKSCVNPEHLDAVSHEENMRRADCSISGEHFAIKQKAKTHCPSGHAYSGDNLILKFNKYGRQRYTPQHRA